MQDLKKLQYFQLIFSAFFILFFLTAAAQAQPKVSKVEPPSWWINHTINPVRLMVRGENFQNAKVTSGSKSLAISNLRVNQNATYLFFDLRIAPDARPGKYEFEVFTSGGRSLIPFEIAAPLNSKKDLQTITNKDAIYLIMTDRFADGDPANDYPPDSPALANDRNNPRAWHGGDFRGIIDHLDYLRELGITAIWLTPWYDNTDQVTTCDKPWCPMTSYHGYGAIDYYGVENHFGTLADLRELVQKANAKGIKVIQDQVANHVGVNHPWVRNPPLGNWFSSFAQNKFNNSALLSPNASPAEVENTLKGWFDFSLPDMNQDEPEVAKYEIQNALWWIGMTGISGIRQDTIQYMPRWFIRDWSNAILKQYPNFYMVGEVFEEDSAHTAFFQGGRTGWDTIDTRLPSVFDFKLWRTSQEVFTGKKPMRALRDVLKYDGLYGDIDRVTVMTNNHDTDRFMSLPGATKEGAKLHTAFMLTMRGIPQLYYGEEILMTGGHDPDNRQDFSGGWREDKTSKFTKAGRTPEEEEMFEWTNKWLGLRCKYLALRQGRTTDLFYDNDVYVFERFTFYATVGASIASSSIIIAFNFADSPKIVTFKQQQSFNSNNLDNLVRETGRKGGASDREIEEHIKEFGKARKSLYEKESYLSLFEENKPITRQADGNFQITIPAKSVMAYSSDSDILAGLNGSCKNK